MNFRFHEDTKTISLLPVESSWWLLEEKGISSITFYKGNRMMAERQIWGRFKKALNANPWMAGRLIRNRRRESVKLVYPNPPLPDHVIETFFHPKPLTVTVGSKMSYEKLCGAARSAVVNKGNKAVNKSDPLVQITLTEDRDDVDGFALIFSMSHVIADGYTYYRIFNSLFEDGESESMVVEREHHAAKRIPESVGKKEYDYIFSKRFMFNALRGMIFGRKAKCYAYYIDKHKIDSIKASVSKGHSKEIDFISTNDILTSSFINTIKCRVCMSAINLRGRIEGLGSDNAGNYEAALLFDDKKGAREIDIRKTLQGGSPYSPTAHLLPSLWEGLWCTMGLITNWAGFAGSFRLNGCTRHLHLPLQSIGMLPMDCAIVFAPKPGRTAVMYFAKTVSDKELRSGCELGEPVDQAIFE